MPLVVHHTMEYSPQEPQNVTLFEEWGRTLAPVMTDISRSGAPSPSPLSTLGQGIDNSSLLSGLDASYRSNSPAAASLATSDLSDRLQHLLALQQAQQLSTDQSSPARGVSPLQPSPLFGALSKLPLVEGDAPDLLTLQAVLAQQQSTPRSPNGSLLGPSNNPLYKTELCRSFMELGSCRYGVKCQFAHGRQELQPVQRHPKYKTEVCRTFSNTGTCPYGTRCRFIHQSAALAKLRVVTGSTPRASAGGTDSPFGSTNQYTQHNHHHHQDLISTSVSAENMLPTALANILQQANQRSSPGGNGGGNGSGNGGAYSNYAAFSTAPAELLNHRSGISTPGSTSLASLVGGGLHSEAVNGGNGATTDGSSSSNGLPSAQALIDALNALNNNDSIITATTASPPPRLDSPLSPSPHFYSHSGVFRSAVAAAELSAPSTPHGSTSGQFTHGGMRRVISDTALTPTPPPSAASSAAHLAAAAGCGGSTGGSTGGGAAVTPPSASRRLPIFSSFATAGSVDNEN